jgi:hypothetical protein
MTITNKNSAYILLKDSCKTNSKITSNWRWGNNSNYSSIFENGNDYDTRREKLEKLNLIFCFSLNQSNNSARVTTNLNCRLNVKAENWSIVQEEEIDFTFISELILPGNRILIFDKETYPELFETINHGYYRNDPLSENIKYIIAIKPDDNSNSPVYTKISSKVWKHFEETYEGSVELTETSKNYLNYLDVNSPLTEGRSPINNIDWFAEPSNRSYGDIVFLEDCSTEIKNTINSIDKVTSIRFKSILKGSKLSLPIFTTSNENHVSGYSLIPYTSELKNQYWCRTTNTIKTMSIKGFICTIDSATIKKYRKARQTLFNFISNLSMFDGEAILDPEKFERLKKEMLKGHNTYSNHIVEIFQQSSNFSSSVKYNQYSKQNINSLNLSSLSTLNTSKQYKELKSITQTVDELNSKIENLNYEISNHTNSVNRSERLIKDQKESIERYEKYIKTCQAEIAKSNDFLKKSDLKLVKNKKELEQNQTVAANLIPEKNKMKKNYEETLNEISFEENQEDKFLKSLNAQGIYILDILYKSKNSNDTISVKENPAIMFNVKKQSLIQSNIYSLHQIKFKLTKPTIVRVDPVEKGEDCPKIAIGPLVVDLTNNNINISPLTSNCILGMNSDKSAFWLHPHTSSFSLPTDSLQSFIDSLMTKNVRGCLGEASSAIYNAFANEDPRQAIFAAMTWLTSANSSDAWGKYWKNFPKVESINSMHTEILQEDYANQLFKSSISDSELILQNFFDQVTSEVFQEDNVDWTLLEEPETATVEIPNMVSEEWEELIDIEEFETSERNITQNQQLRTAGVEGYSPWRNTNNNNNN